MARRRATRRSSARWPRGHPGPSRRGSGRQRARAARATRVASTSRVGPRRPRDTVPGGRRAPAGRRTRPPSRRCTSRTGDRRRRTARAPSRCPAPSRRTPRSRSGTRRWGHNRPRSGRRSAAPWDRSSRAAEGRARPRRPASPRSRARDVARARPRHRRPAPVPRTPRAAPTAQRPASRPGSRLAERTSCELTSRPAGPAKPSAATAEGACRRAPPRARRPSP